MKLSELNNKIKEIAVANNIDLEKEDLAICDAYGIPTQNLNVQYVEFAGKKYIILK